MLISIYKATQSLISVSGPLFVQKLTGPPDFLFYSKIKPQHHFLLYACFPSFYVYLISAYVFPVIMPLCHYLSVCVKLTTQEDQKNFLNFVWPKGYLFG